MRFGLFPAVVVCLACAFSVFGQTVNEAESKVMLGGETAEVSLAIDNPGGRKTTAVTVEIIDANDVIRASAQRSVELKRGRGHYPVSIAVGSLLQDAEGDLAWYRFRYRVGETSGIVSMSELLKDIFEIRVVAADNLLSGMTYRVRVRVANPFNDSPVSGVAVETILSLELKDNDDGLTVKAAGITDRDGFAVMDIPIPVDLKFDGDGEIKIKGTKNGILREANEELTVATGDVQALLMTDKQLYQPEQALNVRAIILKGAEGKTILPGTEVEFRIEDEDDTVLYRERVTTSGFGVAAIRWAIPSAAKLGTYSIRVRADGEQIGYQSVRISRYDLPNFTVNVTPDKKYYVAGENAAEVEVRGDYLFGKPVTKGKVRVVRVNDRKWDWKEQKYNIEEGEAHEGETDAEGKFAAKFDLRDDFKELGEDDWDKFKDLHLTAYFTDLSTNRTEQRRFDIRITKEPIHVYFIGNVSDRHPKLPVRGYVSTYYADGTPASCSVTVRGSEEDEDKYRTLQRVRTNSYGAGRVEFRRPEFEDENSDLELLITAQDTNGKKGTITRDIDFDEDDALLITTNKTIYKPNEPLLVQIESSRNSGLVYVDIVRGWSVVDSYFVDLRNGRAELRVPHKPIFQGELSVAASMQDEDDEDELIRTSRGVIFPAHGGLQVAASFDKAVYKPAEEARLKFSVLDRSGTGAESALGFSIFDLAVEERVRTDTEFGSRFGGIAGWLGYGESFAGVNIKDINELDLSKPISNEMQLVAELMLYDSYYYPNFFRSRSYYTDAKGVYSEYFRKQLAPVEKALTEVFSTQNYRYATDEATLQTILDEKEIGLSTLRDPWGNQYKAEFATEKSMDVVRFRTAGADKKFGTEDDFTASSTNFDYFLPTGIAIRNALLIHHARTGKFIRDERTLLKELGVESLTDRFGRPYQILFEVDGRNYVTRVRSLGQDGKESKYYWAGDDFDVFTDRTDYFQFIDADISKAMNVSKAKPMNETEFAELLADNGLEPAEIRDGYGNRVYLTKQEFSRYSNRTEIANVGKFGETGTRSQTIVTPVTQRVIQFTIRSRGADGRQGTRDDFDLSKYLRVLSEQDKNDEKPKAVVEKLTYAGSTGAIRGVVTDAAGAVIPDASVTATNETSAAARSASTNEHGEFLVANLAPGSYSVRAAANGFVHTLRTGVPVNSGSTTRIDVMLEVGAASATVEVTAAGEVTVDSSSSMISSTVSRQAIEELPKGVNFSSLLKIVPGVRPEALASGFSIDGANGSEQVFVIEGKEFVKDQKGNLVPYIPKSTPRLREYFPETLLWNPEVVTDKNGAAEIRFRMADNITTWKLFTIASTKDGKIGVAEQTVQAFQSFFVDLDPPKFLTEGDEIYLPTQVRNYTDAEQKVNVSMAPADWFSFLGSERQNLNVPAGDSKNAVFGFKATRSIKDGRQRVTAVAPSESDAIEKPVTVRPNGHEVVKTTSKIFRGNTELDVAFPAGSLPGTQNAELKIYPNLFSHVAESVEGLLQRPYGCGEQTVSSTYPNLMILKFSQEDSAMRRKAQRYLQKGYERLTGYQAANGGFTYWGGKDTPDIALTAYALRFLADAAPYIVVDPEIAGRAEAWLVTQQLPDGSWVKQGRYAVDRDQSLMLTTYIVRSIAMRHAMQGSTVSPAAQAAMEKAFTYLRARNAEIDDPYSLALLGLAMMDGGDRVSAQAIASRLEKIAIGEGSEAYWKLETNTPFYGWGTAGRIETTALAVQLLLKVDKDSDAASRGIAFLLKNKDRYGVWYSTQTTINVLDAFVAAIAGEEIHKPRQIRVTINGGIARLFEIDADRIEPLAIELPEMTAGENRIGITDPSGTSIMAQTVATHYVDWKDADVSGGAVNSSRALRLDYSCDRTEAAIMQEISCSMEAERVGFQGYGMLLAEIGIPPGADVSRESLENAMQADWSFTRYDVLPDRVVIYMWARAGGTKVNFRFKQRYGIDALTPASVVYDYYNPEAQALMGPLHFRIK